MRYLLLIANLIGIALLVACAQSLSTPQPAVVVKVTEVTPEPSPTPILCTQNPSGPTIEVQAGGFQLIRVAGRGFQPGESLIFVFTAQTPTGSLRYESRPVQGANSDGTFTWDQTLNAPAGTDARLTWEVAVIHSRGVACGSVRVL